MTTQSEKISKITVQYGGAEIQLPPDVIVRNWLDSLAPSIPAETDRQIPCIGSAWMGGINAGMVRGVGGCPDYFLIVSPKGTHLDNVEWGSQGEEEPNAASHWDGLANTRALVESENQHPAAEKIAALREGGFDDWYLPARQELSIAYGNVPELFDSEWYWSSTQYSANGAVGQTFNSGNQDYNLKGARARAFAVRRVFINSVI